MLGWSKAERDEEFTAFMREASPSLARTAWLLTSDRTLAADLTQEALARTYAAWPRVRRGEALAYARRTLINLNISRWRKSHGEVLDAELDAVAPSHETTVDTRDHVVRLLARLPHQQRAVLVLRYIEDLSEADIAHTLGIAPGTVKSAASRGLAALRDLANAPEGTLA